MRVMRLESQGIQNNIKGGSEMAVTKRRVKSKNVCGSTKARRRKD